MNKKEFFKEHQPLNENFKKLGKENDFVFQALAFMGNATHQMAWANTAVEDLNEVSDDLKAEMKQINEKIHELQERLRSIKFTSRY